VALLEKRRYLNNRSGDFPQVILIVPSHVPNNIYIYRAKYRQSLNREENQCTIYIMKTLKKLRI
jgi:hypothetical protein